MTAPLHPRGTLRSMFEPPVAADLFRRLGVGARSCDLGDEGLYLAEELVAADVGWLGVGDQPEALAVLVLALMIAQRQGSTRLPLAPRGPLKTLVGDILRISKLDLDGARLIKTITHLTAAPRFNSVIGVGEARLPIVVDDGCLYTERSRWLEQRVADRLAERVVFRAIAAPDAPSRPTPAAVVAELRAHPAGRVLSLEQTRAVELALGGALTVITGGPGTGKTLVAAAIVRGLRHLGIEHVALAAQTGKAANRLTQVIGEQLAAVQDPTELDRALIATPPVAQTLHRLLGYGRRRFTYRAQSPLPVGAVIVDEASMIDLELMDALLDALPVTAPLVLIGDAHQLPAIDAGQILADLATPATDDTTPAPDAAAPSADRPAARVRARVAVLATSYRMNQDDPAGRAVYEFARAVQAGDAATIVDSKRLRTPGLVTFSGAEWVDPSKGKRPHDVVLAVVEKTWHHFDGPHALRAAERVFRFIDGEIDPAHAGELAALWAMLDRGRILTVTRALPTGAIAINAYLHERALEGLSVAGRPEFVPGEPVMITANDYHRGLFNGDQGIIVRADEGLDRHHFRAVFRTGGRLRAFAIEALRDRLELSWALTVHKSQGSELDGIALILPHDHLPLVTRELLYTGITRARTGAVVVGSRQVITAGAKAGAMRYSGLEARLHATLG